MLQQTYTIYYTIFHINIPRDITNEGNPEARVMLKFKKKVIKNTKKNPSTYYPNVIN